MKKKLITLTIVLGVLTMGMAGCIGGNNGKINREETHTVSDLSNTYTLTTYGIDGFKMPDIGASEYDEIRYVGDGHSDAMITYTVYAEYTQSASVEDNKEYLVEYLEHSSLLSSVEESERSEHIDVIENEGKEIYVAYEGHEAYFYVPLDDEYITYLLVEVVDTTKDEIDYQSYMFLANSEAYDVEFHK
ncbi:MAG: hypothetical protein J6B50_03335 [Lachnospiraceae bacterium]|nr:hypothetical protein [Lachnospiraceae bacterium]